MPNQTARERVQRCLKFEGPDRVPRHLLRLPWFDHHYPESVQRLQQDYPDDISAVPSPYSPTPKVL